MELNERKLLHQVREMYRKDSHENEKIKKQKNERINEIEKLLNEKKRNIRIYRETELYKNTCKEIEKLEVLIKIIKIE